MKDLTACACTFQQGDDSFMTNSGLTARMTRCLLHQIRWCEQVLQELQTLEEDLRNEDLGTIQERQRQRAKDINLLAEEFRLLMREWQADSSLTQEERTEVGALAARAEALVRELAEAHRHAAQCVGAQLALIEKALVDTRKGRELLSRYRAGAPRQAGYIDREA